MDTVVCRFDSLKRELHRSVMLVLGAMCLFVMCSCETTSAQRTQVEIGVFFGGQVQRISRIEFRATEPQKIGFRLHMPDGRERDTAITYEVVSIGAAGRRITRTQQLRVAAHRQWVDQLIEISDDARLGIFNVRVTDDTTVLADRALFLVEPVIGK